MYVIGYRTLTPVQQAVLILIAEVNPNKAVL